MAVDAAAAASPRRLAVAGGRRSVGLDAPASSRRTGALVAARRLAASLASGWHLTQGTSGVGAGDLLRLRRSGRRPTAAARRHPARLPDPAAGCRHRRRLRPRRRRRAFQSLARNALASPDTLAVTGGAYLAVAAVAAFGLSVPLWASGAGRVRRRARCRRAGARPRRRRRHLDDPAGARRLRGGAGPAGGDRDAAHPVRRGDHQPVRLGQRLAQPARARRLPAGRAGRGRRDRLRAAAGAAGSTCSALGDDTAAVLGVPVRSHPRDRDRARRAADRRRA